MVKTVIALCLLAAIAGISASPLVKPQVPYALRNSYKYFWHPSENGGVMPALLEGGRKLTRADETDIHFHLYTLNDRSGHELTIGDDANFDRSPYVAGAPLKIISHGFGSSASSGPGYGIRDAYFAANKNYNVIVINWEKIAASPWYDTAAAGTKLVGEKTGRLVLYLLARRVVTLDQVHVLGHSLGSHVAGWCGSLIGAGQLGRITALDPALPLFGEKPDSDRIDPSDAAFVDVIHVAGGNILEGGLAFTDPRGHADFYPNGGEPSQPGCVGNDAFGSCSHGMGNKFFEESVGNSNAFMSCQCNTWQEFNTGSCPCTTRANMGDNVSRGTRGRFYLKTNSLRPYSQS